MSTEHLTRRNVLSAGAATAGALTVAACGSSEQPSGDDGAPAPLAKLSDIPVGQSVTAKTPDGEDIVVTRTGQDTAKAFSAKCTHMGCKVQPRNTELHCPCHNSVFNARTGEVRQGPADKPLPSIPVRVANGQVLSDA